MNNQAETPPPDFGFILNQDQPPVTSPKKSKKTVILISVAVALVVLTAALYVFLPGEKSPTVIPSVGAPTSSELLQKFVANLQANQPTEAFSLLSSDYQAKQNLDTFTNQFVKVMNNNVKFDTCVEGPVTDAAQPNNVLQTTCSLPRGVGKITFVVTTKASTEDGKDKVTIDTITWKLDDKVMAADVQ